VPRWALVLVASWGLLVAASFVLGNVADRAGPTCLLRRTTGIPCPTCGSTRAALAAGRGRLLEAFALNPFIVVAGAVAAVMIALRLVTAQRFRLAPRWHRTAWIGLGVALLANWAWVIATQR
jgi:hypothetical protein